MSKFITGFLLGVASGISLAVYSQSERGQELLSNFKDKTDDATENLKAKLDSINDGVSSLVSKAKNAADNTHLKVDEYFDKSLE